MKKGNFGLLYDECGETLLDRNIRQVFGGLLLFGFESVINANLKVSLVRLTFWLTLIPLKENSRYFVTI